MLRLVLAKGLVLSPAHLRWELLQNCLPMLRGYVRRLARDRNEAADLLQETCLRVLVSESAPDDALRFPSWCRGVARHVAAQQR